MGESRCELLESSSKMFYVIFHQEADPKVKKLFYEIIYCKCGAKKSPVLQGLIRQSADKYYKGSKCKQWNVCIRFSRMKTFFRKNIPIMKISPKHCSIKITLNHSSFYFSLKRFLTLLTVSKVN